MSDAFQVLQDRGFICQVTNEAAIRAQLAKRTVFYAGFDPTAASLHVGSLLPLMAMAHMQRAGHIPICILGGGTAMIGDPSGKTTMRKMLTETDITANGKQISQQFARYLQFGEDVGVCINNADWLLNLNFIDFLRDVGKYFKVNEMIKVDAYKSRLDREDGLSFIEFNYMLLQAFDFLRLFDMCGCILQLGGNDQWANMNAGRDLIRKMRDTEAHALTLPLLTTASGAKMGKTEAGAIWLDPEQTPPYVFFQFWVNTDDRDVERFLKLFTFLPLNEITALCAEGGASLRHAKQVLAFEATRITHGVEAAEKARTDSHLAFGSPTASPESLPSTSITRVELQSMRLADILVRTGLSNSKGEASRLIEGGGIYIDGEKMFILLIDFNTTQFRISRGKKIHHIVKIT